MKIWTITNQKGGAGKTVLATNLAVEGSKAGLKTLLIDLDPQLSATKWWEARDIETPLLIRCLYNQLIENLDSAKQQGFDLVIIDTAGREGLKHTEAIEKATFAIIPCQPSLDDCRSALPTVDVIKNAKTPFAFVITRCPVSGDDLQEAKNSLSAIGLVCNTPTIERKCYKRAYADNLGVSEYDSDDKGAGEIKAIFDWINAKESRLENSQLNKEVG
ncbi:MAG: AAA family ATPase [Burkholderiales bacterium]|nr:AAA family ATPase [Burkholderiales bacterium]